MIDVLFEQRVIQNTGLAAEALWHAVQEAHAAKGRAEGVPLPLAFLVLPLVYHQRTAEILAAKTQSGALFKALSEDREIIVGLQARMQAMSNRTWQGLSIAFHTGLIQLDQDRDRQLLPGRRSAPVVHSSHEVKTVLNAAKRVGYAFAEMSIVQLSTHLNIRF